MPVTPATSWDQEIKADSLLKKKKEKEKMGIIFHEVIKYLRLNSCMGLSFSYPV